MRLVVVEIEDRKSGAADEIDSNGTVYGLRLVRDRTIYGKELTPRR